MWGGSMNERDVRADEGDSRVRAFRATDAEWARWSRAAKAAGLKQAEWIRRSLDRELERAAEGEEGRRG